MIKRMKNNRYGYQVDITGKHERELYDRYKKWKGIPDQVPLSDAERFEFEEYVFGKKKNKVNTPESGEIDGAKSRRKH